MRFWYRDEGLGIDIWFQDDISVLNITFLATPPLCQI